MSSDYQAFLASKRRIVSPLGPERPQLLSPKLFDWQQAITKWAVRKGRAAIFADCGLGKSFMQIAWAKCLNEPTIFFAPLCVAPHLPVATRDH